MAIPLALIGYGEAAQAFATAPGFQGLQARRDARAYDVKPLASTCADHGICGCATLAEALAGAHAIFSLVTADQSGVAAHDAAAYIPDNAFFFDMNSVAPGTKRASMKVIEEAGGHYVDVAIMSPVHPGRLAVPLLLSGPCAEAGAAMLGEFGFTNLRVVGDEVGTAATIKMLRSVMYKGIEALTAECLLGCAAAGVTEVVLESLGEGAFADADYRLDRMMVHGERRAAEMREAALTLESLGIEPLMTRGTIARQAAMADLGIRQPPSGLDAKLEVLKQ